MIAKRLLVGFVTFGLVALGIGAIELAPAVRAQQQPPFLVPHGGYGQDTEVCAVCHDWHAEPDPDRSPDQLLTFPWEQLLVEPSETELCCSCHEASGPNTTLEGDFGVDTRK